MGNALMNTKGAAKHLGFTENWIHKLVYTGRLKAYMYDEYGTLRARNSEDKRQGQGLYFYEVDLNRYKARKPGRPIGSKTKRLRTTKHH